MLTCRHNLDGGTDSNEAKGGGGQETTQRHHTVRSLKGAEGNISWHRTVKPRHVTLVIKHDVFRFEVSVNNPVGVEMTESQCDLS